MEPFLTEYGDTYITVFCFDSKEVLSSSLYRIRLTQTNMFDYNYIIAPLLGCLIGYITNALAIRMLFRPHKAKYLLGIHIPFTPGIIPKEKGRIAQSVGLVISNNLMSSDVLGQYLLSDDMIRKLRTAVAGFFETQKNNHETVGEFLCRYLSEDEIRNIRTSIKDNMSAQIHNRLSDSGIGSKIAHIAVESVISELYADDSDGFAETLIGIPRIIGKGVLGLIITALQGPAERFLSQRVNDMLQNNSQEIVSNLIGSEIDVILSRHVDKILVGKDEQIETIISKIVDIYRHVVNEHLPRILQTVDISKVVSERINDMDVAEAEKIILQVMNKELKAIVWLGALLGLLMGAINIFI